MGEQIALQLPRLAQVGVGPRVFFVEQRLLGRPQLDGGYAVTRGVIDDRRVVAGETPKVLHRLAIWQPAESLGQKLVEGIPGLGSNAVALAALIEAVPDCSVVDQCFVDHRIFKWGPKAHGHLFTAEPDLKRHS